MGKFKFAFRNLTRHKRRSVVNFLTIGSVVAMLIVMQIIISGSQSDIVDNSIRMGLGHFKIERKGYDEEAMKLPLDILIHNGASIVEKVREINGISGVSERLITAGILSVGTRRAPVLIEGIDTENEKNVSVFSAASVTGEYIKKGEYGILIGGELARLLNLEKGAMVFLYAKTKDKANNLIDLEVKGIYNVGSTQIERNTVFIPLDIAQVLLNTDGVSEIVITITKQEEIARIEEQLKQKLSGFDVDVFSWKHFAAEIESMMSLQQGFLQMFNFILLIMVIIGIVNTMFMNVWERKKEIGTLRAIGYSRGGIASIFLIESFWTGFWGALIGWFAAFLLGIFLVHYGIPLPKEALSSINIPYASVIRGKMNFSQFIGAFLLGIIASVIAGVIPALRAGQIKIVDALREY